MGSYLCTQNLSVSKLSVRATKINKTSYVNRQRLAHHVALLLTYSGRAST